MKSSPLTRAGLLTFLCTVGLISQSTTASAASGSYNVDNMPAVSPVDGTKLRTPMIGESTLHVLSPSLLELVRVNGSASGSVDSWDFVNSSGGLNAPAASKFSVTVNGKAVAVQSVGFKRRPLYAPLNTRDLRVGNSLFLQLATPIAPGQTVVVKNPDGSLWPGAMKFSAEAHPLRYSPAIHVNQEGYVPGWPKKAAVGYYLGSMGEMPVAKLGYELVDAATGEVVHKGALSTRPDTGWKYSPTPYQKVYEADFSGFKTPGEYKLVVSGLGASLPFMIDEGIGMNFVRAYAQGLYHQRCGHSNKLPYTRFTHDACHTEDALVPSPASSYDFTWKTIAKYANEPNSANPTQRAQRLTSEGSQLFPFVKKGAIDVSGGHHDAGDYSKYTTNAAMLLHLLMVGVDDFPGVAALDNLGLPESRDGVGDILQEAKIEADFIAKLQDDDGGFYFIVYPREREYESNVTPDQGDAQVVWPKTTSATAAAVAALAETGSSPAFKKAYPKDAARYLEQAKRGWAFLEKAIAKHGKDGAYQKLTHYGDDFTHDDELAWAAAAMFAATGDQDIQKKLKAWYDPADSNTRRWGWLHAYSAYGNAARSYAFAARSGRLSQGKLDSGYLAKCEAELLAAGNDALKWSKQSAYGTSFPEATKAVQSAGWYFSSAQAFDITVAHQIEPKPAYLDAIIRNLNYEAGSNPLNVSFITGLGWKRQNEIVHQYAQNDARVLPVNGIPLGNLQTGPVYTGTYGTELAALTYPRDNAGTAPTPFYDRWTDTFNVATEFVHLDQARALSSLAYMATLTKTKSQPWKAAEGEIVGVPSKIAQNTTFKVSMKVPGMDLDGARIVWEASGQQPAYGETYKFTPSGHGAQWIEAEAQWPDGRRVYARKTLFSENGSPTVSVAATDTTATIGKSSDMAAYTFSRTGSTAKAMTVKFKLGGTAAKWTDYRRPKGDMPESIVIPAGAASAKLNLVAIANSTGAKPATVVLTLEGDPDYNMGKSKSGTVTLK
jgi:hypothetical protein